MLSGRCLPFFLFLLSVWGLSSCDLGIRGEFGWTSLDNRGIQKSERSLRIARKFHLNRKHLHFYDHETIWWIYRITSGFYFDDKFLAALYEDNYTPQPILVDLREASLLEEDCCDYIRYYYEDLKAGSYLLRIAYASEVIDEAKFFVFPKRENMQSPIDPINSLDSLGPMDSEESLYLSEDPSAESIDEIEHY